MDEVAANPPAISVRRMREEEQKAVKSLAGRTFPPLGAYSSRLPTTRWLLSATGGWSGQCA